LYRSLIFSDLSRIFSRQSPHIVLPGIDG